MILNNIHSTILEAIKENNFSKLKDTIEKNNVSIDSIGENQNRPLVYTLKNSIDSSENEKIIYYLIDLSKNLNYETEPDGETPLFIALKNKKFKIAKYLLKDENIGSLPKRVNINFKNKYGDNILFHLFKYDAITSYALNLVMSKGIDINATDDEGKSILIYAIEKYKFIYIKQIIQYYIFPSSTVLKLLMFWKNSIPVGTNEIENILIHEYQRINLDSYQKVDSRANDNNGQGENNSNSALLTACNFYNINAIRLFIECRANLNVKDSFGRTPLMFFCSNGYESIAKLLLDHGADINITDDNNKSPLFIACANCQDRAAELFLKNGANPNILASQDNQIYSPLQIAVERNYSSVVDILLKYNANPNIHVKIGRTQEKSTLLIIATKNGNDKIVHSLLAHHAKIDEVDCHLKSGLTYAKENNDTKLIDLYLKFEQKLYHSQNDVLSSPSNKINNNMNKSNIFDKNLKDKNYENGKKEEINEPKNQHGNGYLRDNNVIIYYYSPWFTPEETKTVYIHYKFGTRPWTPLPGIPMYFNKENSCYFIKIPLWESKYIEFCFNDGVNLWDSRYEQNYYVASGSYIIKNYMIFKGKP